MRYTTLCYLENPAGEYLMLHRVKKENDCNRDKWIGIGGKFLDGESPEECALREINEETGLTVTGYRYRGIVTFVSDRWETEYMHLFTATEWTGRVREDCDEGVLEWIHKDRLAALPQWAGDRIFLAGRRAACTVLRNLFPGRHPVSGCDLSPARFNPGFLPH